MEFSKTPTLYCWGYNGKVKLGLGDTTLRNRPMIVQTPGEDLFTDITLGYSHTCGIIENGSVYCWGQNSNGELGDSTTDYSNLPNILNCQHGSKAVAISSGHYHNCAIMDNSSVYCWGYNNYGQLGNGNQTSMNVPVHVNLPLVQTLFKFRAVIDIHARSWITVLCIVGVTMIMSKSRALLLII